MGGKMVRFARGSWRNRSLNVGDYNEFSSDERTVVDSCRMKFPEDFCGIVYDDCTPDEAARLAAICRKYGVAYTIDGKPGGKAKDAIPDAIAGLARWAGRARADCECYYINRGGGSRHKYFYSYTSSGKYREGPSDRNPVKALWRAFQQDEARRAKGGGK